MQVKFRNIGPWTIKAFNALLNHGTNRRPARHYLDDPNTRYLLITNADATGVARNLLVQAWNSGRRNRKFVNACH